MRGIVVVPGILLLLLSFSASNAFAGRIFGDIKMAGKPLAKGSRVKITQPLPAAPANPEAPKVATLADSTVTDEFGSYKLTVKETGKCTLTVVVDKQPVALEIFSNKEATRYDLIVEEKEKGKLSVRRK
jgi:hypothetical protein